MKGTCRRSRPVLAFTSGDPSGIGPEAVLGALRGGSLARACRPVLVGEASVWHRAGWRPGAIPLRDTGLGLRPPAYGRADAAGGAMSFAAVAEAVRLAARGLADAVVTAPISKEAWALAGVPYRDHTEYLRSATGADAQMILAAPQRGLWCVLATRHIPLAGVPSALSGAKVLSAARVLWEALRKTGVKRPRLVLCGLNPHAGEGGLLGHEERRVLIPAVRSARRAGVDLSGPLPADAAWRHHAAGGCYGLVCLYHDQAMIGLKAAAGLGVVNWTAGLPFVRVSPGHGTGPDIAGRGLADPSATLEASSLAVRLCAVR
ncbi:MAG: 4-hydroxythreonine-4-phosphate dehydrogenase PdxA [Elusimicrobia bacterium]|nr:4-hydroxythreonine-4-phosphate dehydrogenase PdxA [Elusimicrobiota bacterium]